MGRTSDPHIYAVGNAAEKADAIVKVFSRVVAMTGANEKRLRASGRAYRCVRSHPMNHAGYYPGAEQMTIKRCFAAGWTLLDVRTPAEHAGGAISGPARSSCAARSVSGGTRPCAPARTRPRGAPVGSGSRPG